MAQKQRISTHKKTRVGTPVPSKSAPETVKYTHRTTEGHGMYCITYGQGKNRKSMTRHCSEQQAEKIVEELTKQGL